MKRFVLLPLACALTTTTLAQVDFSGEWDHPGLFGHEDINDRGQGPEVGDYMGLPLNAAGLRKAESYSGSWLSVPEHQCTPHPAAYQTWGPNTLVVGKTYDHVQRVVNAITLDGTFGLDRVVWMDGREHPPASALHSFSGFSTGHWDGDTLVVTTTHLKAGWLRRNGTPTSEHAQMTEYYQRFDEYLLVTTIVEDPVYLSEPFIRTTEYEMNVRPVPVLGYPFTRNDGPTFYKCFPGEETASDKYYVPHFLPGENPLLDEFAEKYRLPRWVMAAGGATMYPEFAQRIDIGASVDAAAPSTPASMVVDAELQSVQVKERIWLITGAGANITVQVGDEGVLVVDTGTAALAERVRAEIRSFAGDKPIRYIINTHWHADHTGGNVVLSDEGQRAAVLAHENVGLRLALAEAAASTLVMDTYYGDNKTLYFNGEAIEIIKIPNAHTDGDSLVFFRGSDVVVAGDVIDTGSFPRFVTDEDGSISGVLAALNRILDITVAEYRGQGGTIVIPGHGRLYDEADVAEYRDMVTIIRDRVQRALANGDSIAELRASDPALDYSGVFGAPGSDWTGATFVDAVFQQLGGTQ
jgi:glyoxylase-like metal-dependent hydrolase (beta-lactamase superfamily II)